MGKTKIRSTTILAVRKDGHVAMAGDGQCPLGETVCKGNSRKVRKIYDGKILTGFAGSVADAFTLLDKFEVKVKEYNGDIMRASVELAKLWRTERSLQKLEAMLLVADKDKILLISGDGNVIEPEKMPLPSVQAEIMPILRLLLILNHQTFLHVKLLKKAFTLQEASAFTQTKILQSKNYRNFLWKTWIYQYLKIKPIILRARLLSAWTST